MTTRVNKEEARQGRTGFGVRKILVISTGLAALVLLVVALATP